VIIPRNSQISVLIAITLIALVASGLFYFLTFAPPREVVITNNNGSSVSIAWISKKPEVGKIYYSNNPILLYFLPFTFPKLLSISESVSSVNHRVTLSNLDSKSTYSFIISSGFHNYHIYQSSQYENKGKIVQSSKMTILPKIAMDKNLAKKYITIKGKVLDAKNNSIFNALVTSYNLDGAVFSSLTNANGNFELSLPAISTIGLIKIQNGAKQKTIMITPKSLNKFFTINL
jgi:hypothetical protein